jgi:hypothetical protein
MTKPKTFKQMMNKLVNQGQIISGTDEEVNDMEMEIHDFKAENIRLRIALTEYDHKIINLQTIIKVLTNDKFR